MVKRERRYTLISYIRCKSAVIQTGFVQIKLHIFPFVVRVTNCLPSYLKTHDV